MKQKYLVLSLMGAATLGGGTDAFALSDTTNIGDSWKGWPMSSQSAMEQGLEIAKGWIYPAVGARVVFDDNKYNTEDDEEFEKRVEVILPRINIELDDVIGGDVGELINVGAELKYHYNFLDSEDANLGGVVFAEANVSPTDKLDLFAGVGWEYGWEKRGEGIAEGPNARYFDEDIEFSEWAFRFGGKYGAKAERAPQLSFEGAHLDRTYKNFEDETRGRDRTVDQLGTTLSYWVQPNTALTAGVRYFEYDYEADDYDSTQWRYLLGLQWDVTWQTQGYLQLGWGEKYMKGSQFEDASDYNWEAGVRWKPLTYSNFVLSASRDFVEEVGLGWGDLMEYRAAWNHEWTSYIRSSLIFNIGEEDFAGDIREDDLWDVELRANYLARPWLTFDAFARHSERDSNLAGYSYEENVYGLGFNMTFY